MNKQKRRRRREKRKRRKSQKNAPPMAPSLPSVPTWSLIFEDHFSGVALDFTKWETQFPWGRDRSNVGELQWYGEDAFTVRDSILSIEAKPWGGPNPYVSGLISAHKSFSATFGRFEIRCKVPTGKGLWPACWLLPIDTSWPPELDVFEIIGQDTQTVHLTAHLLDQGRHVQYGAEWTGPDFSADFHTFALEWDADRLVWFVDGVERHRYEGPTPRVPMYAIINLAVGGDWPGAPDGQTAFPARFEVDYIRAWERSLSDNERETVRPLDTRK